MLMKDDKGGGEVSQKMTIADKGGGGQANDDDWWRRGGSQEMYEFGWHNMWIKLVNFYRTQVSLVRSMGPSVSQWVTFLKLNWVDSSWWKIPIQN